MNTKPIIHRSHNVYILGAGFSCDAGLPVIANFLDHMRESVSWLASQKRTRELEAVEEVFKLRLRAAGAAYRMRINPENIEELFSLASALKNRGTQYDSPEQSDYVSLAIAATLDYAKWKGRAPGYRMVIRDKDQFQEAIRKPGAAWRFKDKCTDPSNPGDYFDVPAYDFYAGLFSGKWCKHSEDTRNTVITFNYDTLLEDSLTRLDIPFTYALPSHNSSDEILAEAIEPLPVLKLHGSVNWTVLRPSVSGENDFLNFSPDEGFNVYPFGSYKEVMDQPDATPLLLPPTWRKVFGGALARVWDKSVKAIAEATRIIVVGFSLPPTDIHFRYLLAAGLQDNISLRDFIVVNYAGDKDEEKRTRQVQLVEENFNCIFQPLFRDSLKWHFNGARHFFGNLGTLDSIDRTLDHKQFSSVLSPL